MSHAVHSAAFTVLEKRPATHVTQRSGSSRAVLLSYVPGTHGCFLSQNDCPVLCWNSPLLASHAVHAAAFTVLEKRPAMQETQRPASSRTVSLSYVPGTHGCFVWQKLWPVCS
jgi:hypothetical protein